MYWFIRFLYVVLLASGLFSFLGCRMPAEDPAGFVDPKIMRTSPEETAFRREYFAADFKPRSSGKIYIKPVIFSEVLPNDIIDDINARNMLGLWRDDIKDLVDYTHTSLRDAVKKSNRFKLVEQPGPDTLTIEMALVRVVPGKVVYQGGLFFIPFPFGYAVDIGMNSLTGNSFTSVCSMECRVIDGASGTLLMGVADNEKSKVTLLNLLSFLAYGNHRQIVDEWSESIVKQLTLKPNDHIPAPQVFTLINY